MYLKVALFIAFVFILSGCNGFFSPKPKQPKESNKTLIKEQNVTITPIEETNITTSTPKLDKYNFKPEPFSLESNEDDPELLGPQTTLNRDLLSKKNNKNLDKPKVDNKKDKKDKEESKEITTKGVENNRDEAKS